LFYFFLFFKNFPSSTAKEQLTAILPVATVTGVPTGRLGIQHADLGRWFKEKKKKKRKKEKQKKLRDRSEKDKG
jgi:hypothetical protein